ncbi:MAG: hypothetical protein NMNS01_25780 [Nitrosomonas sp.]|nr:MAG: hypothetical protein NMNS01_25780 [Nitrosomonas sp.]
MEDIISLPFAAVKGKGKNKTYSLWHTRPNGNYMDECLLGEQYAHRAIRYMIENDYSPLLGQIILDMKKQKNHSGVEIGFMSVIAKYAIATAAKNTSMQPTK